MITNKRIGVIAGGASAEREVSLRSGSAIHKALEGLGYAPVFIDASDSLCQDLTREGIEIAFLALHGGWGENGAVQGLLEVLGIPYTGSGILASALAMDKEASKRMFLGNNVPVPPFVVVNKSQVGNGGKIDPSLLEAFADFSLPWVIKPVTEGSSIGVSIVRDMSGTEAAVREAFRYGDRILVEKYIPGKEIQIGILEQRVLGGVEVRPSAEFYSYKAKYTPGLTKYILPPEVAPSAYATLSAMALRAHNALGCRGATRVDFILDNDGNPWILEVNTIPGMTETSLLPKIALLSGMDFPALIEEILRLSLEQ
ncbi:MAG: D-alanine--D-alanine ligase [Alphaproteobacteria bacterium]|uniref:D-alanine--D-alanine ligase n=1 Tax=Candidatus Nitrobium versatile TaxID=2884831 RepID=A0A953M351_9BACT|nr:D-alanine--D-alanine ligase [Candidatus Nitrobium versatile]